MIWFKRYSGLADRERSRLQAEFAELDLDVAEGAAVVRGVTRTVGGAGYSTELRVPNDYPRGVPLLLCDRREIPWTIDRHVFPKSGVACLCVESEYRRHWPNGSDLTDFLTRLVVPYFLAQHYCELHGAWPEGGHRSHGREGILEAYRDMLKPLGASVNEKVIHDVMKLMGGTGELRRHLICPCGSGRKLKRCHWPLIWDLRTKIDRRHANRDYQRAFASLQRTATR